MPRPVHMLLLSCIWMGGWGQLFPQQPDLRLSFERQNNFSYAAQLDVDYERQFGKYRIDWNFHHDHLLNSTRKDQPFVQFYLHNDLWQFYDFTRKVSLASWIETDQFFNSQNQRYSGYLGATYKPIRELELTPLMGFSWDYRSGILDQGLSPAFRLRSRYRWDTGLQMDSRLFLRYKDLTPRRQHNALLRSYWTQAFGENATLSVGLEGGSNELDEYRSNSVERIISDTLSPQVNLRYLLLPGVFWDTENQFTLSRRSFLYEPLGGVKPEFNDLAFKQTEFRTSQKISFSRKKLDAYFSYGYEYIVRRYDLQNNQALPELEYERLLQREKQKDYLRQLHSMEFYLLWRARDRQQFIFSGSNRYMQYDTPSEDNFDDHDELSYGLAGEWRSQWSRRFSTTYKLSANLRQYAFLFKERSQDNYTQYALRLEFRFRWQVLKRLLLTGEQFIYVTYNIKDFEDRNFTDRSTRNLESRLEAQYRPNNRFQSRLSLYRKETHVSYIRWETFTETTLDTNRIFIAEWNNRYEVEPPWKKGRLYLNAGYKHFSQIRRQNTAMISLENILTPINLRIRNFQTGPITGIDYGMRRGASIEFSVWWQAQIQDYRYQQIERFASLSARYRESELQEVSLAFRPFLFLKMNIWLGGGKRPPPWDLR